MVAKPPAPHSVKIELTSQCNYRCGFCAHRRPETYYFGTRTTPVHPGDSSLWATYSRLLTLLMIDAFITQREPDGWRTAHNFFEVWNGGVLPMTVYPVGW